MKTEELEQEQARSFVKRHDLVRNGGNVRRYHTHRVICEDTVASHSWGVAVIVDMLCDGNAPARWLRAALYHDVAEHVYGDIPSPAKRLFNNDELRRKEDELMRVHGLFTTLTEWDRFVLKMADLLDGLTYCTQERERGNATLIPIWNTYYTYIKEKLEEGVLAFAPHHSAEREFQTVMDNIGRMAGLIWARMENANAQR